MRGTLTGWDKGRERWPVKVGDEMLMIKECKVFMDSEGGLVSRLWSM